MTDSEKFRHDLLALPAGERAELAWLLFDSLEPARSNEEEDAFERELDRRMGEIVSGRAVGISPEELFARLDAQLAVHKERRR